MQNLTVMLFFLSFDRKYFFCANLVQKFKIVCSKWHFLPRRVQICRIQQRCFLSDLDGKYHFRANLVQKIKIVRLKWNLVLRLIRISRAGWQCSFYFCLRPEVSFLGENFVPKIKIVCWRWHSEPSMCRTWWFSFFSILDYFLS